MKDERIRREDNQPGMDQKREIPNDNYQHTNQAADGADQGQASFFAGSTTQGGSQFGQGSHHLAGDSYHQGDTANAGSNYDNEAGKFSNDQPLNTPHGHGAAGNEKEANAQEDYPGRLNEKARNDRANEEKSDLR